MAAERFRDRVEAGRLLARALERYASDAALLVLALPRGGVIVGAEVARHLQAPLDAILVRKLGVPGHEELAMGAIASGGVRVLNADVIDAYGVSGSDVDAVVRREERELERRAERAGHLVGHRHAAARQREHDHVGAVGVLHQLAGELPPGVVAVAEACGHRGTLPWATAPTVQTACHAGPDSPPSRVRVRPSPARPLQPRRDEL